jgi:hypothetical protein
MSNGVIITAIICLTLVLICWMSRNDNKKGGDKSGKS